MLIHYKALSLMRSRCDNCNGLGRVRAGSRSGSGAHSRLPRREPTDVPMWRVSYRDLNLTYAPHRVTLIRRVNYAVNQVCEEI